MNPDEVVPPRTSMEREVARAWSGALGIDPIGRDDRFTDLGGTSLAAEKVLVDLRTRLAVPAEADLFSDAPTLAELAERIEKRRRAQFRSGTTTCVRLGGPSDPVEPPVFCFAGAGATGVSFLGLAAALGSQRTVYAAHAHGYTSRALPSWTVRSHARRHLRDVLRHQPDGPYYLVGHSFGGHIALAVADLLAARGREVAAVVLLDTVLKKTPHGSVADYRQGAAATPPPLAERLRTHLRVLTAGIVQYDAPTQQAAFWERDIRAQNRIRPGAVPANTVVLVSDQNADQEALWAQSAGPRIRRVPGDHYAVLNAPVQIRAIAEELATPDTRPTS
ncbi:alpha/beta fold hydrolase [Micromonospora sp. NBC_01813]|uniref:alpha/beta fold hydrolase n=1 Tax=Micromonospora sp. NBC_01813 TaxID=2975988 RepID=UPI002DD7DB08|nr:alpha/beta fold hydrolase [Micromonospora sp. NBC_01813]WSA10814.1 alpha/beta fold hydrolase [Micromonospora sp. NBC_01813]